MVAPAGAVETGAAAETAVSARTAARPAQARSGPEARAATGARRATAARAAAVRADLRLLYFEAIQLYRRWEMSSPTARAERADFRLETRGALGHREASFKRTRTRSAAGRSIRIRFFAETKEMKGPLLLHIDS